MLYVSKRVSLVQGHPQGIKLAAEPGEESLTGPCPVAAGRATLDLRY